MPVRFLGPAVVQIAAVLRRTLVQQCIFSSLRGQVGLVGHGYYGFLGR